MKKVALVAVVKNEGPYLLEWIGYHLMLGIDHVYLYDDGSADDSQKAYEIMYKTGKLTVHRALKTDRRHKTQEDCYEEWRRQYGHLYTFMMPWDGDEFLNLRIGTTLQQFLDAIPEDVGQVRLNWKVFGSNGHLFANYDKFVIERFTRHAQAECYFSHVTKLVLRVDAMGPINDETDQSRAICAHCSSILPEYRSVAADLLTDVERDGAEITPIVWDGYGACNHYQVKSLEEFLSVKTPKTKRGPTGQDPEIGSHVDPGYFFARDRNEEVDESMLRYVEPLRKYIEGVKTIVLPRG